MAQFLWLQTKGNRFVSRGLGCNELEREKEKMGVIMMMHLHSLPSFSTIHSIAALPLLLFEDTVLTMIPSM